MALENKSVQETDATRAAEGKKKVAVVVLLIVFVIAMLTQPDNDDSGDPGVVDQNRSAGANPLAADMQPVIATPTSTTESASAVRPSAQSQVSISLQETRQLSRFDLQEITACVLMTPEPKQRQLAQSHQRQQVQAIYGTSEQRAALMGESIVRDGETLPTGETVLRVTTDGIRVGP